ncbi:MAG: hypothetical protein Q4D38_10275 [Planctomycetia bacterium]|nr:hypothetical protein [Planctomycetia bacterium]
MRFRFVLSVLMVLPTAFFACANADAQDAKEYLLTKKNGPWLVMAAVFGDYNPQVACDRAVALATELRRDHRLNAYIYVRNTGDSGDVVEGTPYWVFDEDAQDSQLKVSNRYKLANPTTQAEFAVLVGDFPSLDDRRAARLLEQIRAFHPKCMAGAKYSHPIIGMAQAQDGAQNPEQRLGPLSRAFIVANPLVPREQFVSAGLDPIVVAANKDIKRYSLLDCPGTYTVQVAVLKGISTLNQQDIARIKMSDQDGTGFAVRGQTLGQADKRAVLLCEALRSKGYEAYVFRDHYSSIVTIGSFNEIGSHQNGQFVLFPEVMQILKNFSATCDPSKGIAGIQRKNINQIPGRGKAVRGEVASVLFDVTPRIVVVPKRPVLGAR